MILKKGYTETGRQVTAGETENRRLSHRRDESEVLLDVVKI